MAVASALETGRERDGEGREGEIQATGIVIG